MKQVSRLFLGLTFLYTLLIFALGAWWLYLIVQYGGRLSSIIGQKESARVISMVKWEGLTFFFLLILLTASLLFLYFKDLKKTKSLQAFFASMTHELKTPLASVKLQGEVIADVVENIDFKKVAYDNAYSSNIEQRVTRLSHRLVEDANKLETTMDKILQLSRVEGGGNLHLTQLDLRSIFETIFSKHGGSLVIHADWNHHHLIIADEFALGLIIKNLLENTLIHGNQNNIWIETKDTQDGVQLIYEDKGRFRGEVQKLGTLFYKHNSNKGSGIGLYLIKTLMHKMNGTWDFQANECMRFFFTFKKGERNEWE